MKRHVKVTPESWPLNAVFNISRGAKKVADVVVVEITEGEITGYGECVPYPRYGESQEQVIEAILAVSQKVEEGASREELQALLPAGAARNALDCALWQVEAKRQDKSLAELFGLKQFRPVRTAQTVSLDSPEKMGEAAKWLGEGLLKVKLGPNDISESVRAVRRAAPKATLILDANEAWTMEQLVENMPALIEAEVKLIEQPLPQGADGELAGYESPIPICADESCHASDTLTEVSKLYDAINIKLDKTGGLTEALKLRKEAESLGMGIFLGCMICTSLSILPVFALTEGVEFIDIDGPLWLKKDRDGGCKFNGIRMSPPTQLIV